MLEGSEAAGYVTRRTHKRLGFASHAEAPKNLNKIPH